MMELTTGILLPRTYLFVPPEEKSEVQALGACWDADRKCWYTDTHETSPFSRWLPGAPEDDEFSIVSDHANVAAARIPCQHCHALTEVICVHCDGGTVDGDELPPFTVSNIGVMDETLARQLAAWPMFRRVDAPNGEGQFANHCHHCGIPQDDMLLHSEPDQPFFDIPNAAPGSVKLTPLSGTVQLIGDEHFSL